MGKNSLWISRHAGETSDLRICEHQKKYWKKKGINLLASKMQTRIELRK